MKHRRKPRRLFIGVGDDHIIILHLSVGKCLYHPALFRLGPSRILLYNGHIVKRLGIALINLEDLIQRAAGLIIILPPHI